MLLMFSLHLGCYYTAKLEEPYIGPPREGRTEFVALFRDNQITIPNPRDSCCVLSRNGQAIESTEHQPDHPDESARIEPAGGRVLLEEIDKMQDGRIVTVLDVARIAGKIAISRTIGDLEYEQDQSLTNAEQTMTCNPDIHTGGTDPRAICDRLASCMGSQDKSPVYRNSGSSVNRKRKRYAAGTMQHEEIKIRNTVTCSLDGTREQVARSLEESIIHVLNWNKLHGTEVSYDSVLGHKASMFTTRPSGTFHYLLKYEGDGVNLIIDGFTGWCYGFVNSEGIWLFKPSAPLPSNYIHNIQHIGMKVLPFEAIYTEISPDKLIEKIEVGIDPIRDATKDMARYDGSTDAIILQKLKISVGRVIFPVCEGYKYNQVLELKISAIKRGITTTVGDSEKPTTALRVKGWSHICTASNSSFYHFLYRGVPMLPFSFQKDFGGIKTVEQALKYINVAPYKSVNNRMCHHQQRVTCTWNRVEDGQGDEEVCLLGRVDLSKFSLSYQDKFKRETEFFLGRRVGGPAHWTVKNFLDRRRPSDWNPYQASLLIAYGEKVPSPRCTARVQLFTGTWPAKLARVIRNFKL